MIRINNYTENQLLQEVAAGNEHAFKSLFDTYHKRLFHYISAIVKSSEVAEEIVMDVFMKIWLGRELAPQIEHFNAFLFRVAYNKSIDFLRAVGKDPMLQDLLLEQMQVSSDIHADTSMILKEYEDKIREAVMLLSPQRKKVYQLSRQMEMTHDQIAAHLNLSKHTVNNHIVEAQRFVRSYLAERFDIAYLVTLVLSGTLQF